MDYKQEQYMRMQQYQNAARTPFYMSYPLQNVYMTELEYERDMERMKELYPQEAKRIQKLVEEECDKLEYEGSMMFDEYPDRVMLRVICDRIYQLASGPLEQPEQEKPEPAVNQVKELSAEQDVEELNFRWNPGPPPGGGWPPPPPPGRPPGGGWPPPPPPPPGRPPGGGWPPPPPPPPQNAGLGNLIEVLLYNEMYKRRCRHNRCRRWW